MATFNDAVVFNTVAISLKKLLSFYKEIYEDTYDAFYAVDQIIRELYISKHADIVDITDDVAEDEWCACEHGFCTLARLIKEQEWYSNEIKVFLILDL